MTRDGKTLVFAGIIVALVATHPKRKKAVNDTVAVAAGASWDGCPKPPQGHCCLPYLPVVTTPGGVVV